MSLVRAIVWLVVLGAFLVSFGLLYSAATNEASRSVKFHFRHLFTRRRIDESSTLQLVLEAGLGIGLALAVLFGILV